jgi:hypothetical protein
MQLKIDPTHAETFASTINEVAAEHRSGEYVVILPGEPGSGLVTVALQPLDGSEPRFKRPALGSLK